MRTGAASAAPVSGTSDAGIQLGELRGLLGDLARGRPPRLLVLAALRRFGERLVDELAELHVALLDADSVGLFGEGLLHQLELAAALLGQAEQDHVVRGDRL